MDHPAANQPAHLVGSEIIAGQNAHNARRLLGSRDIELLDRRMCMRRTQEIGISLSLPVDIICVLALAGDEPEIFLAEHRGSNACS